MNRFHTHLVLIASLFGVAACQSAPDAPTPTPSPPSWEEMYEAWEEPDPIPDFPLVDQNGRAFRLGELADGHVFIGFVFSRCPVPTACPLTMKKMREVQEQWEKKAASGGTDGRQLHLLTVTLDPEFDTPAVLKAYGRGYKVDEKTWTLATGEPELVSKALPSLFNVLALPAGEGNISHGVKAALLGPGLKAMHEWEDNDFDPDEIVARVLGEGSRT